MKWNFYDECQAGKRLIYLRLSSVSSFQNNPSEQTSCDQHWIFWLENAFLLWNRYLCFMWSFIFHKCLDIHLAVGGHYPVTIFISFWHYLISEIMTRRKRVADRKNSLLYYMNKQIHELELIVVVCWKKYYTNN